MSENAVCADLKTLADAAEIRSPTRYAVLGVERDIPPAPNAPPQPDGPPAALLAALEAELYSRLYTRPSGDPSMTGGDWLAQRDHVNALSAANNGVGTWEPGWKIIAQEADGRFAVARDQVKFWVASQGLRTLNGRFQPGGFCRVWVGKELRQLMPGFYCAVGNGNQRAERDRTDPLVRIYWNLAPDAAVPYMRAITMRLNQVGLPFRTKVLSNPKGYNRADAGVLYFERRLFRQVREIVGEVYKEIKSGLKPAVPLFTKVVQPGVGLAEDPDNGLSFGQSRCKIAARALWACCVRRAADADARLAELVTAFRAEKMDPEHLYLNPGSADNYHFSPRGGSRPNAARRLEKDAK